MLLRDRPPSQSRGIAAVELAISVNLLFLFVFGIIEFSRLGMAAQLLTNAARELRAILDHKGGHQDSWIVQVGEVDGHDPARSAAATIQSGQLRTERQHPHPLLDRHATTTAAGTLDHDRAQEGAQ